MMIDKLKKYNERFMKDASQGDLSSDEVFEFTNRSSDLILSAPHATRSFCNKKEKMADLYTGALVQYLGEVCDVSTLVRTKFTPYKALISDYIEQHNLEEHYFLDIHGFNKDIGYDVCLGTASFQQKGYPYLTAVEEVARKYNLKTIINHENYTGKNGLTGRYQRAYNRPNVIQMELKLYLRDFYNNPEVVENVTIPFFNDVIKCYK